MNVGTGVARKAKAVRTLANTLTPVARLAKRRILGQKSPFQMTLSLTNRCNFRCEYCEIPLQRRAEISAGEWKTIIDELRAAGLGRASLIGGEPLLYKDVGQVIGYLVDRGVHTAMNTNGWFVRDYLDDVAKLDMVCITLDGPENVHDRQRHSGSYRRVIEALELLTERGVPVVTMTVLTPSSADRVEHVLEIARRFGHRAFFQLEHDKGCDVMLPIAARMSDSRIVELVDRLLELKDAGAPVGNSRAILRRHAERGRYLGTCEECFAGRYFGYILSDGTVAPCLLTASQPEQQNGQRLGAVRAFEELAPPEGPGCSCVPTHQVNQILGLDLSVLWHAVTLVMDDATPQRV